MLNGQLGNKTFGPLDPHHREFQTNVGIVAHDNIAYASFIGTFPI